MLAGSITIVDMTVFEFAGELRGELCIGRDVLRLEKSLEDSGDHLDALFIGNATNH